MPLITQELDRQVRETIRRNGLVVWFDPAGQFTSYADSLAAQHVAGTFPHPVVRFRGSYLDLLFAASPHVRGLDRAPLLVHLAGLAPGDVVHTPALEIVRAGGQFEIQLPHLVQRVASGRVDPAALAAQLANPALTLEAADEWLDAAVRARDGHLEGRLATLSPEAFVDELWTDRDGFCGEPIDATVIQAVAAHAHRQTGVTAAWRAFANDLRQPADPLEALARETRAVLSWALAVEYVHDLKERAPFTDELRSLHTVPAPLVATCRTIADHARQRHGVRYVRLALELQDHLPLERANAKAEDLGSIDTMRFEAELVLRAAIADVAAGRGQRASGWAETRKLGAFWLRQNPRLGAAWELVGLAADLLHTIDTHAPSLQGIASLDDAIDRYAGGLWPVDQAHRRLLQRMAVLLEPELPFYADIRDALREARVRWRAWADDLAKAFSALCRREGFLPSEARQQRTLFEQAVQPRASGGKTALILVDALRYEMAEELRRALGESAQVQIQARLCELPSLTSVGMNVLAPVAASGVLSPVFAAGRFKGFRTGEFTVDGPESRVRAMFLRVGGRKVPRLELDEAATLPPAELKPRISGASLVVVHSRAIDDAGEAGLGVEHFDRELQRLVTACRNLQNAGIRQLVLTADHGFLLQDETARVHRYGRSIDPSRRHVWSADVHDQTGLVTVPLAALRYTGADGCLLMPEDTGVFETGPGNRGSFVHGGGSLQERVIPVVTVQFPAAADDLAPVCAVEVRRGAPVAGMSCVHLRLVPAPGVVDLPFAAAAASHDVRVRAAGRSEIGGSIIAARPETHWRDGRLRIPVEESWTEVFFTLAGPEDARAAVEVVAGDAGREAVGRLDDLFPVTGRAPAPTARPAGAANLAWVDKVPEDTRKVARHLAQNGSVTESDLVLLLGSPRAARMFALRFEDFQNVCPFPLRVVHTEAGKVYERE